MLGYVGEISPDELDAPARSVYRPGDKVGKTGVEARDRRVPPRRRRAGARSASTRWAGRRARSQLRREARPGKAVRLTIDIGLQRAAEQALRYGIATAQREQVVLRGRRRDRRARPARRRGARDGLEPDVQAVGLRRAASTRRRSQPLVERQGREGAELPGHQPRHAAASTRPARPGSRSPRSRRCRSTCSQPVPVDPVHADRDVRPRQAGVPQLGPVRQPAR